VIDFALFVENHGWRLETAWWVSKRAQFIAVSAFGKTSTVQKYWRLSGFKTGRPTGCLRHKESFI
jgi:hypothetical protein